MLPSPFFVDEVPADLGLDEAWMGREVLNSLLARRDVATEDPHLQHGALHEPFFFSFLFRRRGTPAAAPLHAGYRAPEGAPGRGRLELA